MAKADGFAGRIASVEGAVSASAAQQKALIARELGAMARSWNELTVCAGECRDKYEVLGRYLEGIAGDLQSLPRYEEKIASQPRLSLPPRVDFVRASAGGWTISEQLSESMTQSMRLAREAAREAGMRVFPRRYREEAARQSGQARSLGEAVAQELHRLESEEQRLLQQRAQEAGQLRSAADERIRSVAHELRTARARLPPAMSPWASPSWSSWSPELTHPQVLAGVLKLRPGQIPGSSHGFAWDLSAPVFVPIREGILLRHAAEDRGVAHALARSLILRALACTPAGKIRLQIFDPTGLGQSVASILELAEYDRELLGGKVWSSAGDLGRVLSEQTSHIELVIQKYLRAEYATLEQFNDAAGGISEPYRLLVVFDYPERFDEAAGAELHRIVENGPRCGIGVLILSNRHTRPPHGIELPDLPRSLTEIAIGGVVTESIEGAAVGFDFLPETDEATPAEVVASIVDKVGRGAQASTSAAVSFETIFALFADAALMGRKQGLPQLSTSVSIEDESTWWTQTTVAGVSAPIGQRGARDVATLTFDSSDHAGALLVGRPGSGKSTLLHTFLAGITTLYGPKELELHLIDFKEGVEFKVYAEEGLPHARSVAIESDREFGVSVLQAMQAELSWRGSLLRGSEGSHASLESLRTATGKQLPRVVLLFDEFQVLFARNDKLGGVAAEALEQLIRQGRGFGIHVLLGSQSLAGLDALGAHVPQLLPIRILLPASEADAFRVLGEGNPEGAHLSSAGEGILNMAGGLVEANERFRGAVIGESARADRIRILRKRADEEGFRRRPIVFEGNAPIPAEDMSPERFRDELRGAQPSTVRLRFGVPMAIAGSADVDLRREAGANVLVVARDTPGGELPTGPRFSLPRAVFANAALSAAVNEARVEVVDFMPPDNGLEEALASLVEAGVVHVSRRRQVPALLSELREQLERRIASEDITRSPVCLLLFGMHRARDFDVSSIDFDGASDLPELLRAIVTDGPEVGIHTLMWFETLTSISRRVSHEILRECGWRVAGKMSSEDSLSLLDVDGASSLRDQQLLLSNDDLGELRRCTAISEPPPAWMRELSTCIGQARVIV
jgi:S-DNA-T family DNA segregation ATPase FtsK/SpoIIIE